MQIFKPFRATVHRQQKYYSQKRINQKIGSIFNLPRQVINKPSTIVISPQIINNSSQKIRSSSHQNKSFLDQYQTNLKKNIKKNSIDMLKRKALQKSAFSLVVTPEKIKKSQQKIVRNKSFDSVKNKDMSFQTLNILYRTIIETKAKRKSKLKFEVNAKKFPILQKSLPKNQHNGQVKKNTQQVLVRNIPFIDKNPDQQNKKYNNNDRQKISSRRHEHRDRQNNKSSLSLTEQNEKLHIISHRRRFERRPSSSLGLNEIVPWKQMSDIEQQSMYPVKGFVG